MRVFQPTRRPPTIPERLLGRRHARILRRRLGLFALGAGYTLLRPRSRWSRRVTAVAVLAACVAITLHAV